MLDAALPTPHQWVDLIQYHPVFNQIDISTSIHRILRTRPTVHPRNITQSVSIPRLGNPSAVSSYLIHIKKMRQMKPTTTLQGNRRSPFASRFVTGNKLFTVVATKPSSSLHFHHRPLATSLRTNRKGKSVCAQFIRQQNRMVHRIRPDVHDDAQRSAFARMINFETLQSCVHRLDLVQAYAK